MNGNRRTVIIAKAACFSGLAAVCLLVPTFLSLISINIVFVFMSALSTAAMLFESYKNWRWCLIIYFVTIVVAFICGGVAKPLLIAVYALVMAPYFIFSNWMDARVKMWIIRFVFKSAVMTTVCVMFFVVMSPIVESVNMVMVKLGELPLKLFHMQDAPLLLGIVIAFSVLGIAGNATIPIIDFVVDRFRKIYLRMNRLKTVPQQIPEEPQEDAEAKEEDTDGVSDVSLLVNGIITMALGATLGLPGIVLGTITVERVKRYTEEGKPLTGMAKVGSLLANVGLGLGIFVLVIGVTLAIVLTKYRIQQ